MTEYHKNERGALPPIPTGAVVMFRIFTRRDWDTLQEWHEMCEGSQIEHPYLGTYALVFPGWCDACSDEAAA